jgi:NADPH-dependent glutamate synthase beta subunit-like oxidoreductase
VRHIAVIGSGPAGYYTAEAAQKHWGDEVRIDIFDMLPVPYGLIRTGVAPDHQSIKAVYRRYETTNLTDNVRFVGNVMIGRDVSVVELQELYDAVVLATGAPNDKPAGTTAIRNSLRWVRISRAKMPWLSAMGTSRWMLRGSLPRPVRNSMAVTS